jgi:spore maturation protein CgeB
MDEGFAGRIAEAGYRRVLAEHTYVHRVRAILKLVNA